jgi:hypothetical protein
MLERRKSDRARTFLGGMIAFNKCNSTMDCRVRDISSTGARDHLTNTAVILTNTAVIPDQFDLTIARKERSFRARMVWRSVDEAGVAFLGEYNNEMPVSLDLARRLRQSEAEKTVLRKRIAQLTENGAA